MSFLSLSLSPKRVFPSRLRVVSGPRLWSPALASFHQPSPLQAYLSPHHLPRHRRPAINVSHDDRASTSAENVLIALIMRLSSVKRRDRWRMLCYSGTVFDGSGTLHVNSGTSGRFDGLTDDRWLRRCLFHQPIVLRRLMPAGQGGLVPGFGSDWILGSQAEMVASGGFLDAQGLLRRAWLF